MPIDPIYIKKVKEERKKYQQKMREGKDPRSFMSVDKGLHDIQFRRSDGYYSPHMSHNQLLANPSNELKLRKSLIRSSNMKEFETSFLATQEKFKKEEIENLRSASEVRLKSILLEERSKLKREVESKNFEMQKELKETILKYKTSALEEYNIMSK